MNSYFKKLSQKIKKDIIKSKVYQKGIDAYGHQRYELFSSDSRI